MLVGHYYTKLGAKGRVALPKKFRDELGEKVIIARWYEKCVAVVSLKAWEEMIAKITGGERMITTNVRDTDRFLLASAFEVELDDQGRFVIPPDLREFAGLNAELVFLGVGNRVEIWDKDSWSKHEGYIAEHAEDLIEELAGREVRGKI